MNKPRALEPHPFGATAFRQRVAVRLLHEHGARVGDHVFNPHLPESLFDLPRIPAAVLIPVIAREPEATMLLTERTGALRAHAGQIAFPGGRIDAGDAGPEAAALREAHEEIGLDAGFVEMIGRGPDYLTGSGYHVALVVALVQPGFTLSLNPAEVASTFEVPLSFLMNPANHRMGSREWNGARRSFYEMPFADRHIWGITAGIIRVLYERLYARSPEPAA